MRKKLLNFLIWFCIFGVSLISTSLMNLVSVRADSPPDLSVVEFARSHDTDTNPLKQTVNINIPVNAIPVSTTDITVNYKLSGGVMADSGYQVTDENNGVLTVIAGDLGAFLSLSVEHLQKECVKDESLIVNLTAVSDNAVLGSRTSYIYYLDDNCPKTTLTIDPANPTGQNGWYLSAPKIYLKADPSSAKTYYQWDSDTRGNWLPYSDVITAKEGQHKLYYLSKNCNEAYAREKEQVKVVNVDSLAPLAPQVSATVDNNGHVQLSWELVSDAASYTVTRVDTAMSRNVGNVSSLLDDTTLRGNTYTYEVTATDSAGNISAPGAVTVSVPNITVSSVPCTTAVHHKIKKAIATGANSQSTISQETPSTTVSPQVQGTNDTNNPATDTSSSNKDWSRLLLALSILVIAAGVAIGGYYGYEWWMEKRGGNTPKSSPPKSKSRW